MRRSAAPQPDDVGWLENPRRRSRVPDGRELWTYRELAAFLALRDLKARYKQAETTIRARRGRGQKRRRR